MHKIYQALILSLAISALAACNTVNGAGEDLSSGGQAISKAATSVQKKI